MAWKGEVLHPGPFAQNQSEALEELLQVAWWEALLVLLRALPSVVPLAA